MLDRNHFNIGLEIVRGAKIEHRLGFSDASDHRPGDRTISIWAVA